MRNIYCDFCDQYFDHLTKIKKKQDSPLKNARKIIALTTQSLQELKALVLKHQFANQKEEIHFFKILKPKIFSQLIYYAKVKQVESTLPYFSCLEEKERYLRNKLRIISRFFQRNTDFYRYMNNELSHMDDKYFVRGHLNCHLFEDSFLPMTDQFFSTCYDLKASYLLAYDKLTMYLKNKIKNIHEQEDDSFIVNNTPPLMQWTGTKIALVELIYALQASGCINNGNVSIKEVKEMFERVIEIDLTDYYRLFLEIKARNSTTKFIDKLCEDLNRKIETQNQ
ncbi:MAG TPA: RteC domain-containing protein [Edaphocola sp.]|nr:RteC domain-containing protein [Edaphocola sp.]